MEKKFWAIVVHSSKMQKFATVSSQICIMRYVQRTLLLSTIVCSCSICGPCFVAECSSYILGVNLRKVHSENFCATFYRDWAKKHDRGYCVMQTVVSLTIDFPSFFVIWKLLRLSNWRHHQQQKTLLEIYRVLILWRDNFHQLCKEVHLALKTFVFAGPRSYCPDFLFQKLIKEDKNLIIVFISTWYWAN